MSKTVLHVKRKLLCLCQKKKKIEYFINKELSLDVKVFCIDKGIK